MSEDEAFEIIMCAALNAEQAVEEDISSGHTELDLYSTLNGFHEFALRLALALGGDSLFDRVDATCHEMWDLLWPRIHDKVRFKTDVHNYHYYEVVARVGPWPYRVGVSYKGAGPIIWANETKLKKV